MKLLLPIKPLLGLFLLAACVSLPTPAFSEGDVPVRTEKAGSAAAGTASEQGMAILVDHQSATLSWNPVQDPNVSGYHVYIGLKTGTYTGVVDVGNTTTYTFSVLIRGLTYFFAVTAYDAEGHESPFSEEVSKTVASPQLRTGFY